jgi:hypothetical protein
MVEKNAALRQRRAADMRACRKRQSAGIALFYVAADETTYEMMKRFGGLDPNKIEDKQAVRDLERRNDQLKAEISTLMRLLVARSKSGA